MVSAITFHAVNTAVTVLFLPVLLFYLEPTEYAIWLIFTAFGGATIQLQNAIQGVSVKDIARGLYLGDGLTFALQRMHSGYALLTFIVSVPVLLLGLAYLTAIGSSEFLIAWIAFISGYGIIYSFSPKFSLMLGSGRVSTCNNINTITRLMYFLLSLVSLHLGFGILGICTSFVCANVTAALLSTLATKAYKRPPWRWSLGARMKSFIGFSASAFLLYNGSVIVAALLFPRELIASYGLGLQIGLLLVSLSLAPLPVWLSRLMNAIARGVEHRELRRNLLMVNCLFGVGAACVLIAGPRLIGFIDSSVTLPNALGLILLAYAIELNISTLVNFLMAKGDYRFIPVYVSTSTAAIVIGTLIAYISGSIYGFVVVPLIIQSLVCLPRIIWLTWPNVTRPVRGNS